MVSEKSRRNMKKNDWNTRAYILHRLLKIIDELSSFGIDIPRNSCPIPWNCMMIKESWKNMEKWLLYVGLKPASISKDYTLFKFIWHGHSTKFVYYSMKLNDYKKNSKNNKEKHRRNTDIPVNNEKKKAYKFFRRKFTRRRKMI